MGHKLIGAQMHNANIEQTEFMKCQDKQKQETFREKVHSLLGIPVKLILASSLLIVNIFAARAQQKQLKNIIRKARDSHLASQEAKNQLFNFYDYFKSTGSILCPIMIRQYNPSSENQQYQSGLLINGEYEWSKAFGAIRKHLKVQAGVSISFFCKKEIIGSGRVLEFYERHKDSEGVLYVQYIKMQSFG